MNLVVKTKLPSTKAALEVDTNERIEAFRKAYKEITGKECPVR